MRVILLLMLVFAAAIWGGIRIRKQDETAAWILFFIAGLAALGFLGGFFGWF